MNIYFYRLLTLMLLICAFTAHLKAQKIKELAQKVSPTFDVEIKKTSYYDATHGNDHGVIEFRKRFNPINSIFGGLMLLYQNSITQQIGANCNYTLTCSNFSKRSIEQYGLIKGIFLSSDRLMRCNSSCVNESHPSLINGENKAQDTPDKYSVSDK